MKKFAFSVLPLLVACGLQETVTKKSEDKNKPRSETATETCTDVALAECKTQDQPPSPNSPTSPETDLLARCADLVTNKDSLAAYPVTLVVDLSVVRRNPVTGADQPYSGLELQPASLVDEFTIDCAEGSECPSPTWMRFAGGENLVTATPRSQAMNTVTTDAEGKAHFCFSTEKTPAEAGIVPEKTGLYAVPELSIRWPVALFYAWGFKPKVLTSNHWQVAVALPLCFPAETGECKQQYGNILAEPPNR